MNKKKIFIISILLLLVIGGIIFLLTSNKTNQDTTEYYLPFEVDYDSDEDIDGDGLSNKEEKKYGTNATLVDTDMDGLLDGYEINTSKTDPLKVDSDNDGLNDYNEVVLKYNPNDEKSNNKNKKDNYSFKYDNVKLSVTGTGNIADTYVLIDKNTNFLDNDALINKEYNIYSEGELDKVNITIGYTKEELDAIDTEVDYPEIGIFRVNKEDYTDYYYVKSTIDKKNMTISATLEDTNKYFYVVANGKDFEYKGSGGGAGTSFAKDDAEWRLVVDNGFDPKKNGFSFKNYGSTFASSGHCFGMAIFADLYYTKTMPLKSSGKEYGIPLTKGSIISIPIFKPSYSYDLTNTYFSDYSNLYDYKLSNYLTKKMAKEKSKFDEEKMQTDKKMKNEDLQLLNAIYMDYTMQFEMTRYYTGALSIFSSSETNVSCLVEFGYQTCGFNGIKYIDILKERMYGKEAPVIIHTIYGKHAVNATRLYRKNKNPNYYRLYVYDNNYPGDDTRYIDFTCSHSSCTIVDNNGPFAFVKSLDEELKYFKNS